KGLSKEKGIDLILISDNMWKRHDAIYAKAVSPEEFIDLFYNASYVVTNSFHGTAFSINLNKQFFIELPPPPSTRNSRMENILDLFSLRDRLIINGKNEHKNDSIDYESLNRKMEKERRKSIEVLKRIIKEEAV
ncbi:MAG: polysaccharide pyruvyl transferase family protein, partial [Bacillota bacterium]|nr:polysaccharide pyruvyl transferase family protein [Bacillota bacterium]